MRAFLELRRRQGDKGALTARQCMAADSPAFETLFGGAAGPGKTYLGVWLARNRHYHSLLLRRTFPQLEDSLILEAKRQGGGRDLKYYNASKYVFAYPDGRRIRFGHLEHEKSIFQYQSAQFDLIVFDELTQYTRLMYEYLLSRARTTKPGQRVRIMSCSNPGGLGHRWVKERWAPWLDKRHPNPAKPGELRWFKRIGDGIEVETTEHDLDGVSRTFIPARLDDNPHLGDEYRKILNLLPEPYRTQLKDGDWEIGDEDDERQVIPTAWLCLATDRWAEDDGDDIPVTALGCDIARGGPDATVIVPVRGTWFGWPKKYPGKVTTNGPQVGALIVRELEARGIAAVDEIGVGSAVRDTLEANDIPMIPVNFAASAETASGKPITDRSGRLRLANMRAACYWGLREALDPENGMELAIPPDPELISELLAPRWELTTRGVKIESKDDIKARLGRSPDKADALVMGAWVVCSAGQVPFVLSARKRESNSIKEQYFDGHGFS